MESEWAMYMFLPAPLLRISMDCLSWIVAVLKVRPQHVFGYLAAVLDEWKITRKDGNASTVAFTHPEVKPGGIAQHS